MFQFKGLYINTTTTIPTFPDDAKPEFPQKYRCIFTCVISVSLLVHYAASTALTKHEVGAWGKSTCSTCLLWLKLFTIFISGLSIIAIAWQPVTRGAPWFSTWETMMEHSKIKQHKHFKRWNTSLIDECFLIKVVKRSEKFEATIKLQNWTGKEWKLWRDFNHLDFYLEQKRY